MSLLANGLMMAVQLFLASLLLLLLLLVTLQVDAEDSSEARRQLKPEDWQPIHQQIYGSQVKHYLAPEKTLELLKQLQVIYAPFSDEETNGRKSKTEQLIEASQLRGEKCNEAYLVELQQMQDRYSPFRFAIIPYIGHAIRLYLDMCEVNLIKNLHDQVRDLEPETKGNLLALVNATNEVKYGGYSVRERSPLSDIWLHFGHMIDGVVDYLEHKLTRSKMLAMLEEKNEKNERGTQSIRSFNFQQIFQHYVMDVCTSWTKITDPIVAFHKNDLRLKYTDEEIEWISYGFFCHFIERNRDSIVKKSYRQFKRRTSRFPKLIVEAHRQFRKINCFDPFS